MQEELQCRIATPCGEIIGNKRDGAQVFLGIPYATADRFCYPKEVTEWTGALDATAFGNCCYQRRAFYNEAEEAVTFYYNEFRKGVEFTYGEDCLVLNVYAPQGAENAPVVVFIHGGSFTSCSANELATDGMSLTASGIITVTLNYRLNVFGCFVNEETAAKGMNGNLMLYDQYTAIEWVRHNVAAFGGNADNITLMGQSAGAMCAQTLIESPLLQGKIKGAVLLSGGGSRPSPLSPRPAKANYAYWNEVMHGLGVKNVAELTQQSARRLYEGWQAKGGLKASLATLPVIDGTLVTSKKAPVTVPCIIGVLQNDMCPPLLNYMAAKQARVMAKQGVPCYRFGFLRSLPGDRRGAFHSADLWYIFGSLKKCWRPFEQEDYRISGEMQGHFAAFFRGQTPTADGLPDWSVCKGKKDIRFFK